jgi:hypothetical protein
MTALATRPRHIVLPAYSRAWWAFWKRCVMTGQPVAAMVVAAKRGRSWLAPADEIIADRWLTAIDVDSGAYDRWKAWFIRKGIELPRPARCPVIFLDAPEPPNA